MGGRVAGVFSSTRELVRIGWRDPEHISERLTLYASQRLASPSREWAEAVREERPDTPRAEIAEELRASSAYVARVDGAIAGTPFFVALVPGYLSYVWQEARMALRMAALYGHDPGDMRTAAETLALRGVHPTVEAAEAALVAVRDRPSPERAQHRRPLRLWYRSGYSVLVFGGFLSAPSQSGSRPHGVRELARAVASLAAAGILWATTWLLPVTTMIAMAWACESHARQLGRRAAVLYDGEAATAEAAIALAHRRRERGHSRRDVVRAILLALSIAVPIAFVVYADHVRNTTGVNWLGALGALVAVSVVAATTVAAARR
jgi:hypothetical protein